MSLNKADYTTIGSICFIFFLAFLGMVFADGVSSSSFYDKCAAACSPSLVMTPVMGGHKVCLCDEGQGKWRRVDVGNAW